MRAPITLALAFIATASLAYSQEEQSKIVAKLSSAQIRVLVDSRDRAYAELRRKASACDSASELHGKRTNTTVLDLDDAKGIAKLAGAERFLKAEAASKSVGITPFLQTLADPAPLARDLAVRRLLQTNSCTTAVACEKGMLVAAQRLLASEDANDRREAVNWLRK
jgi:hypothetical protein